MFENFVRTWLARINSNVGHSDRGRNKLRLYKTFKQNYSVENYWKIDRVKQIWYLSPMRAAKVQASLRIRAVSPEPALLAHSSSESRGTFRQKARSLAPLNGWACAVKIWHDWMLEDTNSLDGAQMILPVRHREAFSKFRCGVAPIRIETGLFEGQQSVFALHSSWCHFIQSWRSGVDRHSYPVYNT